MVHLRREVEERAADTGDAHEIADAMLLLAALADMQGIDLARAVAEKLAINEARRWGPPGTAGVIEHERGA